MLGTGGLHTGDIGSLDADGYILILDRKKDMIIRSGFSVYPGQVDEVRYPTPRQAMRAPSAFRMKNGGETVKEAPLTGSQMTPSLSSESGI
jgi:long-chain acyl-CoA synthetase